jgi:plastocyanin
VLLKSMMRPRRLPLVAAPIALALALAPASAPAAVTQVGIDNANNAFVSKSVTLALGDSVSFTNNPMLFPAAGASGGPGQHNVAWDAGDFRTQPSDAHATDPWTLGFAFKRPGLYRYYCTFHGGPGGLDMSGKVVVRNADGSLPSAPVITRARAVRGTSRVTVKFTSSVAGTATGRLTRRQGRSFRTFGSVRFTFRTGANSVVIRRTTSGKRLGAGTYRLALSFSGPAAHLASSKTLNFSLSR